jgi:hypothetical protein
MAKTKKNDTVKEETIEIVEEKIDPVVVVSEYVSADKSLKAVLKHNRLSSLYEIDFYKDKKKIATESYAFHTRRYHEDAAENYVNGIKKI